MCAVLHVCVCVCVAFNMKAAGISEIFMTSQEGGREGGREREREIERDREKEGGWGSGGGGVRGPGCRNRRNAQTGDGSQSKIPPTTEAL